MKKNIVFILISIMFVLIFVKYIVNMSVKRHDALVLEATATNLRYIGWLQLCYQDSRNSLPPMDSMEHFKLALKPCQEMLIKKPKNFDEIFIEPDANDAYILNGSISNKKLYEINRPTETWIVRDKIPHGQIICVLYVDAHTEYVRVNGKFPNVEQIVKNKFVIVTTRHTHK